MKNRDNTKSMDVEKLFIEITNSCNLNCIHCVELNGKVAKCSCTSIKNKKSLDSSQIPLSLWKDVIDDAEILECREIFIMGGEPFIKKREVLEIIKYAFNKIPLIRIKTNLLLLDEEILHSIKKHKVGVETTFFSRKESIYDQITDSKGNLEIWIKNCKKLIENEIDVHIKIELMELNRNYLAESLEYLCGLGIKRNHIATTLIYSFSNNIWSSKHKDILHKNVKQIKGITKDQYFYNIERNPCWFGKIAIAYNGEVMPCPMARLFKIGDIKKMRLLDIMRRGLQVKYWTLTKDKINKCRRCEFRYACHDCRPIESKDNSLTGGNKFCTVY